MLVFIFLLAYMIVKFRTFNIKLLGTQALVWGMTFLIGAQFFFIKNKTNYFLNGFTFIASLFFGQLLIQSVKNEVYQREVLERINNELKVVPGSIYIDHLSEVVRRKFRVGAQLNVEEAITRRAYTDFPQQCATLLAAPASKGGLGCKVWYAHQAKGAVANYRPVDLPSNTWSEGCTSIAENNVFTMVFGIPSVINELRNMGVINDDLMRFNPAVLRYNITKCRFNMPVPSYGLLARYSAICRFDCGDSEYVVSESTRELISRRDSDVGNSRQNRPRITRTAVQLPGGSF
jgi:hypothetical protein